MHFIDILGSKPNQQKNKNINEIPLQNSCCFVVLVLILKCFGFDPKTIKMKQKNKNVDFSACYLVHQVLVYLLKGKRMKGQIRGRGVIRVGEGTIKADQGF